MKKFILAGLITILSIFSLAVMAQAADYTIPQAAVAPTIDGKATSENEWYGAYHLFMNYEKGYEWMGTLGDGGALVQGRVNDRENACKGYDIYMMYYNDANESKSDILDVKQGGIYIKVVAQDKSRGTGMSGRDAFNAGTDVLQVVICPLNTKSRPSNKNSSFLYDFPFYTTNFGPASFYEHYQFNADKTVLGQLGIKTQCTLSSDEYFLEIQIPWVALNLSNRLPTHKVGSKMGIGLVLMDWIGQSQFYMVADFGSGMDFTAALENPRKYNTVTFGETVYAPGTEPTTDFSALKAAIEAGKALSQADYTAATWKVFQSALNDAEAVSSSAAQSEVDSAVAALNSAMAALLKVSEATPFQILQSTISSVDGYLEEEYEPDTWAVLKTALEAAKQITEQNSDAEINEANEKLTAAIMNLLKLGETREKADLSVLNTLLNTVDTLSEKSFTADDWAALQEVVSAAKLFTTQTTQYEIDEAVAKIQALLAKEIPQSETPKSEAPAQTEEETKGFPTWAIVLIIVGVVVVAAAVVVLLLVKKKKAASESSQPASDITEKDGQNSLEGEKPADEQNSFEEKQNQSDEGNQ